MTTFDQQMTELKQAWKKLSADIRAEIEIRWGFVRLGDWNLAWWMPHEWKPLDVRETMGGRRVLHLRGFAITAWRRARWLDEALGALNRIDDQTWDTLIEHWNSEEMVPCAVCSSPVPARLGICPGTLDGEPSQCELKVMKERGHA